MLFTMEARGIFSDSLQGRIMGKQRSPAPWPQGLARSKCTLATGDALGNLRESRAPLSTAWGEPLSICGAPQGSHHSSGLGLHVSLALLKLHADKNQPSLFTFLYDSKKHLPVSRDCKYGLT